MAKNIQNIQNIDLAYFQDIQSRLLSAKQNGNDGAMLEALKSLEDNLNSTTRDLLKESGLGAMLKTLTSWTGSPRVCEKSKALKERLMRTLNIKASLKDEAASPAKLKRPSTVSTAGQEVKRARQAPAAEQAPIVSKVSDALSGFPLSHSGRSSQESSTRVSDSEYCDEPLSDVLGGIPVSVDIAAHDTVDKDGRVPLNIKHTWFDNGHDQRSLWQVARTYSKDRIKLPEKWLPKNEQDFIDTGVTVHDDKGYTYDLSKTLLKAYSGCACGACGESIGGVCFIQDGSTCHYGCIDFSRQYTDTRSDNNTLILRIEWPARALPKGWGKPKPAQKSVPFCQVCGHTKVFFTHENANNDIKCRVFCPECL